MSGHVFSLRCVLHSYGVLFFGSHIIIFFHMCIFSMMGHRVNFKWRILSWIIMGVSTIRCLVFSVGVSPGI